MRFSHKKLLTVSMLILLLVVSAAAVTGCGQSLNAAGILNQSKQSMDPLTSVKMQMQLSGQTLGQGFDGTVDIDEAMSSNGVKMKMSGSVAGQQMVAYIADGNMYMQVMGQWMKLPMQGMGSANSLGMGSIDTVTQSLGAAKDAKVVAEDGSTYTIAFKLDSEALKQAAQSAKTSVPGLADQLDTSVLSGSSVNYTVKVDKQSHMVTQVDMNMKMGTGGTSTVKMLITGYNVPVDVTVPPAALNAPDMQIPSF